MHYTQAIATFGVLTSLVSASPVPASSSGKSQFSVTQAATGRKIPRSGRAAYAKALAKYGVNVTNFAVSDVSGSVGANPTQYDSQYLSPVSVGGQTLNLDFDTGSADL